MWLRAGDIISGQEATATAKINGEVVDLFFIKSFEATMEKTKTEVRTLGHRGVQSKATGWSGTGSCSLFYVTSVFRKLMTEYAKNGKDTYFDITVTNNDPTSTIGAQTACFYNCNINSAVLAKFDTESEFLDEEFEFTFDGFEYLDEFGLPVQA